MKKVLSFLLTAVMLFSMLPFNALAKEDNTEREKLLSLACEVFPEYANKIMNILTPQSPVARFIENKDAPVLVASETRNVSENTQLTYMEYSDGVIYLTEIEDRYYYDPDTENYESSAYAVHATISITATSNINQSYFKLSNVSYSLFNGAYDQFTNTGTASTVAYCSVCEGYPHIRTTETASLSAMIAYRLNWIASSEPGDVHNSLLTITIRNNNVEITHVDNT